MSPDQMTNAPLQLNAQPTSSAWNPPSRDSQMMQRMVERVNRMEMRMQGQLMSNDKRKPKAQKINKKKIKNNKKGINLN